MEYTGETLNFVFRSRGDGTFELEVREHWSGHSVKGNFIPPYTTRQLNPVLKRLNTLDRDDEELQEVGYRLFSALCGTLSGGQVNETVQGLPIEPIDAESRRASAAAGSQLKVSRREYSKQSIRSLLRGVIQRTLRRRGTVALTLSFAPGCDEFVR